MATIRRARGYGRYLLALFISGFVSLLGRPSPSWAEAARAEHNAMVFRNTYLVAKASTNMPAGGGTSVTARPAWPSQGMEISKNKAPAWPSQGMEIGKQVAPAWPSQGMEVSKRSPAWPSQGMEIGKQVTPETPFLLNLDPQIFSKLETIQNKVRNNETTTPEEDALVISVQNAAKIEELSAQMRKIDDLSNQLNVLLLKLNSPQNKAPSE